MPEDFHDHDCRERAPDAIDPIGVAMALAFIILGSMWLTGLVAALLKVLFS